MTENTTTKPRRLGKIALIAAAPVALIAGCVGGVGIGGSTDAAPTETVTETPEPVTETVTPEPEVVTEEVEVETVPQACLDALTDAETVNSYNSDALSMAGDAIVAASEFDTATLNSITDELGVMKDEMDPYTLSYATNAGLCRDAAEEEN